MSTGVVVVKEWEKMVVLRWGQYIGNRDRGLHFLVPFVFDGRIVDLREQVEPVPTQKYITKDNVVIDMDFVLYYRVLPDQAEKSIIGVTDHRLAVRNQAVADLRSIFGTITLAEALAERERIQSHLQAVLDENTGRWGSRCWE